MATAVGCIPIGPNSVRSDQVDYADAISEARKRLTLTNIVKTRYGDVMLAESAVFEDAFGETPPHPEDGPHLAGFSIRCRSLECFGGLGLKKVKDGYILPASRNFGTALRFTK